MNSQFAIHCEFPYCFKVDTALKKQVLEKCFQSMFFILQIFNSISSSQDKWSQVHMQSKSSKLWGAVVEKYRQKFNVLEPFRGTWSVSGTWASEESFYTFVKTCLPCPGDNWSVTTFGSWINCFQISSLILVCCQVGSLISSWQISS